MPRLDERTKRRILELAFRTDGQQPLNAPRILEQLSLENARLGKEEYVITSERSIQKYVKKVKGQETESMELDRQPWSLLQNEKAGIAFDPILLQLLKLWFRQQVQHGQKPPFVAFPVGIAKWATRLHEVAPTLPDEELLRNARRYFAMERMALLDGMQLDSSRDDLEIAMKGETDERLEAPYEDFYGDTIRFQGEEVQTKEGTVLVIPVPANKAKQIISKGRRRDKK